jgi:L-ribulose-5-phosphate 3-epimerase
MSAFISAADRRDFLRAGAAAGAGLALGAAGLPRLLAAAANEPPFKISLAEWSIHRTLNDHKMQNIDFPAFAKNECGIDAVEYVDQFFKDKARDQAYLTELKKRCDDLGVTSVLIMCDTAGDLGNADEAKRKQAVENHHQWVEAAKFLGCHSIRVNARSSGSRDEQAKLAADGLRQLGEYGAKHEIGVIVENHGGWSSNADWLVEVMKAVDMPNVGTLPDFGNFKISDAETYDRYKGVEQLMPYAKGVSAKSYKFDADDNETTLDYPRLMKIVQAAGYHGRVGIEFEGAGDEKEGIMATKRCLERILASESAAKG